MYRLYMLFLFIFFSSFVYGQEPITIEANIVTYDSDGQVVIAEGDVLVKQNNFALIADKIIYEKKTKNLYAYGKITFNNDQKNQFFATKAFFNMLKNTGTITNFKARLSKKSNLSSDLAVVLSKQRFVVKNVFFSSCDICKNNIISNKPLWVIQAKMLEIDTQKEVLKYRKSILKFMDIPIMYLPYFVMPTPAAKSKSGFLSPDIKNSNIFGMQISTPYYFSILSNMDLIYRPTFSRKGSILHNLHFRHLLRKGNYDALLYITHQDNRESFDMFLDFKGKFKIKRYSLVYDIKFLKDPFKTFTEKYFISQNNVLSSQLSLKYENENSQFIAYALGFQDLRNSDFISSNNTTYVIPRLSYIRKYSVNSDINIILSADIMNFRQKKVSSYEKAVLQFDVLKDMKFLYGNLHINPSIRNEYMDKNFPSFRAVIKYDLPFFKKMGMGNFIFSPIINFKLDTSHELFPDNVQGDGFSELAMNNVFASQDGDIVRKGLLYGFKMNYSSVDKNYGAVFAQYHKIKTKDPLKSHMYSWDDEFFTQKRSIISKLYLHIKENISIMNNTSINPSNFSIIKNEIEGQIQNKKLAVNFGHILINKKYINKEFNLYNQELLLGFKVNFLRYWWLNFEGKRKLGKLDSSEIKHQSEVERKNVKSKWVNNSISILYKGDCLNVNFGVERDYSRLKNLKSSVTTYLKIQPVLN